MTMPREITRRDLFVKLGIFCNGIVGVILAVPIARYLLSPVARARRAGYDSWIPLGDVEQFPSGETRFATYRNPVVNPGDGDTAKIACWVRNVDGKSFQVFAINCAHLGCPVRWFPQSSLFMCPCHGVAGRGGQKASSIVEGSFLALVSDQGLRTIVIAGRPEIGDPDWRGDIPGKPMSAQDVSDVVAWLASQRPKFPGQPFPTTAKVIGEIR